MSEKNKAEITSLFNQHADYLFNYTITRVNDQHVAEELVQETFISAFKSYDSFQQKSKASTWLIAILKNKIIDHYRKKLREYKKESLDQINESGDFFTDKGKWKKDQRPHEWNVDSVQQIEKEEFYMTLHYCLQRLNEIQRIAFVMKHLEDVDTTEICKELDITTSNYWVIIHRAKLQLRKCMETNWIQI
jgi:RNA polymerase sigma-70 factor (ECF subfamily)